MDKFPELTVGEIVYVNASIVGEADSAWRPALVTKVHYDSIDCSVFTQEQTMLKLDPRTNVRYHRDPKLLDPQFLANFSNDDDAGIFRLTDARVLAEQKMDAILTALESIATDPKGSKTQVEAILNSLRDKPESGIEKPEAIQDDSWRVSRITPKREQSAAEKNAVLESAM